MNYYIYIYMNIICRTECPVNNVGFSKRVANVDNSLIYFEVAASIIT